MNTDQILDAYGASVTATGGALVIAGMVKGYREARTYYEYNREEAVAQWLREFGHEIVCRYCGGTATEAELTQYCTECVDAHESRACDTAGYCEICDTDNGWVSTPDKEISFQHCGRPAYWEGDDVFCNKCNEELTDTEPTEPDGWLCVECAYRSEGVHEDDAPTHNEKGYLFMGNLTGWRANIVFGAELEFSDNPCTGCTGALAGYRYAVTLTERTTQ
jgi:hypothetical protein